ncbi:MAG: Slp family lipoprotein [Gammaproteobacteria bacterium]|nr:Slp family lipoprotein [Gammaproteobacteria bacterium]
MTRVLPPLLLLLLLGGCSSKPLLPTEGINSELTAQQVVDSGKGMVGSRVLWGGVIVAVTNLRERTRLEVLAYPLDSTQRPQTDKAAGRRFLAYYPGYLESADYAAGRQVSLVGTVSGIEEAPLGEHRYRYPVVDSEKLHLWPVEAPQSEPKVRFGIGVILHN